MRQSRQMGKWMLVATRPTSLSLSFGQHNFLSIIHSGWAKTWASFSVNFIGPWTWTSLRIFLISYVSSAHSLDRPKSDGSPTCPQVLG